MSINQDLIHSLRDEWFKEQLYRINPLIKIMNIVALLMVPLL